MNRFWAIFIAVICAIAAYTNTFAQTPVSTVQGNSRVEYRFYYNGDGSPIRVIASETGVNSVVITVLTTEQAEAGRRGENVSPIGRATKIREDTLQYAGGFRVPGVYYVVVQNITKDALTYRISITGDGVSGAARVAPNAQSMTSQIVDQKGQRILSVNAVFKNVTSTLELPMPTVPAACTPANSVKNPVQASLKLCPGQVYAPMSIIGNNIAIYSDEGRSAIVASAGRQYAITMEGTNNWIEGVTIQARADAKDAGAWLCLYEECVLPTRPVTTTITGGVQYGGGILLKGSNTTIHNVTVRGGTIGIASVNGRGNKFIENNLSDLGWGSFNLYSRDSYFIGNKFDRNNRGCTPPSNKTGCETAGWVCLGCTGNVIARNSCELSGNCFYMNGERGLKSDSNNFFGNYCGGASENCFAITSDTSSSFGNVLRDNIATMDSQGTRACKYPFWIGGAVAYFADNAWECSITEEVAFNQSRDSTRVPTNIIRLDNYLGALNAPRIDTLPAEAFILPPQSRWAPEMTE